MEQDRYSALKRFDCGNSVALNGGHEEQMGLREELLEIFVADEAVKVDAVANAEVLSRAA